MEAQLHHPHGPHHDDLHSAGAGNVHEEDEHGVEKKSAIKKVKAKVHKLKETIKHGHGHHDDEYHNHAEKIMNESPAVRSGLVEPTDMGKAVLAEDLYATHSDILDTPVRSFAQWEEEEKHGAPPPLSTGIYGTAGMSQVGHRGFGQDVNREQSKGNIQKSTGATTAVSPANNQTKVTDPTKTDLSQVGHNEFDQGMNKEKLRGGTGKPTGVEEGPIGPNPTTAVSAAHRETKVTDYGQDVSREQLRGGIGKPTGVEEDTIGPNPTTVVSADDRQTKVTDVYGQDVNREQLRGGIGKSTGMVEDPSAPNPTTAISPANHQTKVTDPMKTGGKEAGITQVLRSFDKMGVYNEPHSKSSESHQKEPKVSTESHDASKYSQSDQNQPKMYTESHDHSKSSECEHNEPKVYIGSHDHYKPLESDQNEPKVHTGSHDHSKYPESDQNEPNVFTGSHDQFTPEPIENIPLSTIAGDPSSHSSSYTEETTSASDKAAAAKDLMVYKLDSSGENRNDETKSPLPTKYAHKVAETVTEKLGPVYETVVGVGSSVMSKMHGSDDENLATTRITEKKEGSVKDYLGERLKPSDEDKVVSDVITHAFHRGKGEPPQEITSIYVREEVAGEGRVQDSGN